MVSDSRKTWLGWTAAGLVAAGGVAWRFWPSVPHGENATSASGHPQGSHNHAQVPPHGGTPTQALALSDQARQNLELRTEKIALSDYWRSLTVPAEVIEEPGHCEQRITTSIDGFVRKIHILKGQTVYPGDKLFDLELAGGQLAEVQANLLRTVQNLELVNAELARIGPLADQGTIPRRTLLDKQFEQKRLGIQRDTEYQELLIRGLTEEQLAGIIESKTLLRKFTVRVPPAPSRDKADDDDHDDDHGETSAQLVKPTGLTELTDYTHHAHGTVYTVEKINVVLGDPVKMGDRLGELALHTMLLIEGRAFEREATVVERVMAQSWPVEAHFETGDLEPLVRKNLSILSIENALDSAGRTLKFYMPLVNEVFLDREVGGISYRNWRFRPGQKVRLMLPVEFMKDRIVVPLDAVVREGADAYVFRANGRLLERVPVVIEHQDVMNVVLGRGSKVRQGDHIAVNQAYQLNLMLRQAESGGAAGHHDHDH